jgi:hypothetical protein
MLTLSMSVHFSYSTVRYSGSALQLRYSSTNAVQLFMALFPTYL